MQLSLTRKLIYSAIATLVSLSVLEIATRLVTREVIQVSIPAEEVRAHTELGGLAYHPRLGWTWAQVPEPKLGISTAGFRYAEIHKKKPSGTWRAFTLGDSQTYGAHIDADKTYTYVAEQRLRQLKPGTRLELINSGLPGYHSLQALRLIRDKLLDYAPDLLVIDCEPLDSPRESADVLTPRWPRLERVLFQSKLYYMMRLGIEKLRDRASRQDKPEWGKERLLRTKPNRPGNHDLIAELAKAAGVHLLFIDYPVWAGGTAQIECRTPTIALPPGFPMVRTCDALRATGLQPAQLFFDNNHLSEAGARVVGEQLARAILEYRFLP